MGMLSSMRSKMKSHRASPIPRGAWCVVVVNQAQRLEDELNRLDVRTAPDRVGHIVRENLERARSAATPQRDLFARLRDWWSGAHIETAWSSLHAAGEALLSIEAPQTVNARLPDIAAAVKANFKTDDPRLKAYADALAAFQKQQSLHHDDIPQIVAIHHAANTASDMAHSNVRAYRNMLLLVGIALSLALILIAALHALAPGFLSIPNPKDGDAPEVWAIEIMGGLGGMIAAVLALGRLGGFSGPYSLPAYQALLRIPTASATSLFGILLLQSKALGALDPVSGLAIYAYAVLFGYAQEPLLRSIDRQASKVLEPARSKDDPARQSSTAAQP